MCLSDLLLGVLGWLLLNSTEGKATQSRRSGTSNDDVGSRAEDLKLIEGIGPKIEGLLLSARIRTYGDLKNASQERLRAILSDAALQFRRHDPGTWPQQAAYAAAGDWEGLNDFKARLSAGRET